MQCISETIHSYNFTVLSRGYRWARKTIRAAWSFRSRWLPMNKTQLVMYHPRRAISFNDGFTTELSIPSIFSTLAHVLRELPVRRTVKSWETSPATTLTLPATFTCSFFRSVHHSWLNLTPNSLISSPQWEMILLFFP